MNFIKGFIKKIFISQITGFKFIDLLGDGIWQQMQNYNTLSAKLRQLGQKTHGHGL